MITTNWKMVSKSTAFFHHFGTVVRCKYLPSHPEMEDKICSPPRDFEKMVGKCLPSTRFSRKIFAVHPHLVGKCLPSTHIWYQENTYRPPTFRKKCLPTSRFGMQNFHLWFFLKFFSVWIDYPRTVEFFLNCFESGE